MIGLRTTVVKEDNPDPVVCAFASEDRLGNVLHRLKVIVRRRDHAPGVVDHDDYVRIFRHRVKQVVLVEHQVVRVETTGNEVEVEVEINVAGIDGQSMRRSRKVGVGSSGKAQVPVVTASVDENARLLGNGTALARRFD